MTGYLDLNLTDDKFAKHLCVANGFEVKPVGAANNFEDVTDFLAENPLPTCEDISEPIPDEE